MKMSRDAKPDKTILWGTLVLMGLSLANVGDARADPRQDMIDNAARCAALSDDRQWLDCVYGSLQPMRARLGLPPATEAQIRLSGIPTAKDDSAKQSFGLPPPPPLLLDHVSARLTTFTLDQHGLFTAVLSNGQVWRQISGDTTLARWNPKKAAQYVIVISSGVLGSYNLQVQGQPYRFKVERLR
jgi:hypothetical protein